MPIAEWQPIDTAPRDGTWILGCNNRGQQAVIIWKEYAFDHTGLSKSGWIHPFTHGELSPFFNSAFSNATHWQPLPAPPPQDSISPTDH